jgi:hypothetical protein
MPRAWPAPGALFSWQVSMLPSNGNVETLQRTVILQAGSWARSYYHSVVAFIVSVVLTAVGAAVSAGWHVLSRNGSPEFEDLGVGFDILVGAMVMQVAFIPGSHGEQAPVRWGGVGVLFIMLMVMAVATRFHGYLPAVIYRSDGREDLILYPMKSAAVKVTSSIGCAVLCAFWWLNVNIEWVLKVWKDLH